MQHLVNLLNSYCEIFVVTKYGKFALSIESINEYDEYTEYCDLDDNSFILYADSRVETIGNDSYLITHDGDEISVSII